MKRLMLGLVVATTLFVSSNASASGSGYVCSVRRLIGSSWGTAGATLSQYYTEPFCGGTFLAARYYCSSGSTSGVCSSSPAYVHAREDLNTLTTMLLTAASQASLVDFVDSTTCNGGASICGGGVYFYGQ